MSTQYEVDVTVTSGKNLKNVNWKNGNLRSYVVLWVDYSTKCSTKVDVDNDEDPLWDEKITLPLRGSSIDDAYLYMDVVHAGEEQDVKPLVGSGRLSLGEVVEEAGVGDKVTRTVKLKRPSGRSHGKVELEVRVKEKSYYGGQYGGGGYDSRDTSHGHDQPPNPYGAPPPTGHPYSDPYGAPPPSGYPPYGAPPQHGYPPYGAPPHSGDQYGGSYGGQHYEEEKKKKSGMGSSVAMGAAAGLVGGLAIGAGVTYLATRDDDDEGGDGEEEVGGFDDE